MFMALVGAVAALLCCSRLHDAQLKALAGSVSARPPGREAR